MDQGTFRIDILKHRFEDNHFVLLSMTDPEGKLELQSLVQNKEKLQEIIDTLIKAKEQAWGN